MPVTKDRLHICTRGTVIDSFICLIMLDFYSSHPTALSLSEAMILHISFFLWQGKLEYTNHVLLNVINGIFICGWYGLGQDSANICKKRVEFICVITFPSFVMAPFTLYLALTTVYFLPFITASITCHNFFRFDLCFSNISWKCNKIFFTITTCLRIHI